MAGRGRRRFFFAANEMKPAAFAGAAVFARAAASAAAPVAFFAALALLAAVSLSSCPAHTLIESDKITFFVSLNLDDELMARYQAVRVSVTGEDGEKIGVSSGPFNDKFKIMLSESYINSMQRFTVEFRRESSTLDSMEVIAGNNAALDILKSFYYISDEVLIEEGKAEYVIPAGTEENPDPAPITIDNLKMGFSDGSSDILEQLPNLPPLYKIEIGVLPDSLTVHSYQAQFGAVTEAGGRLPVRDNYTIDPNDALGFCGGDDWFLVLNEERAEGDTVCMWLFFTSADPTLPTRVFYRDKVVLPALFGVISLDIDVTSIPVLNEAVFAALIVSGDPSDRYILTADYYDLTTLNEDGYWTGPAQVAAGIFKNFSGVFDGLGADVNIDLSIPSTAVIDGGKSYYGLFGKLSAGAVIKNLNVFVMRSEPCTYNPSSTCGCNAKCACQTYCAFGYDYLGGVAGYADGAVIRDVNVHGTNPNLLDGKGVNVGGFVGYEDNSDIDFPFSCNQDVASVPWNP